MPTRCWRTSSDGPPWRPCAETGAIPRKPTNVPPATGAPERERRPSASRTPPRPARPRRTLEHEPGTRLPSTTRVLRRMCGLRCPLLRMRPLRVVGEALVPQVHAELGVARCEGLELRETLGGSRWIGVEGAGLDAVLPPPGGVAAVAREELRALRAAHEVSHAAVGVTGDVDGVDRVVAEHVEDRELSVGARLHRPLPQRT